MSDQSAIEWTDSTWNPVRGCVKVSPGCANCYAETFAERWRGVPGHPYEQGFDLRLVPEKLEEPLRWKKPRRVFVNSMSDLFQDGVPDWFVDEVFAVMALAPHHTFQVLTKRAERMRAYFDRGAGLRIEEHLHERMSAVQHALWPLPNVWLGVSVENQHFADERIPLLLQTPAAVRFISAEPLLERVDLSGFIPKHQPWKPYVECRHGFDACPICDSNPNPALEWVIVGGESGPGARPFDVGFARSIVAQCKAAGVPVFVKQIGADPRDAAAERDDMCARETWPVGFMPVRDTWPAGWMPTIDGRRVWRPDLTSRKGGDMAEWPEDLRVRQFPEVRS